MNIVGIIPARYHSTRFPGKPLALILGKPMIQHVFERAAGSASLQKLVVATDDHRIFRAVRDFGGEVIMTGEHHASGTDRLAEAGTKLGLAPEDIVANIQGDEPLVRPEMVDALVAALALAQDCPMATLAHPSNSDEDFHNPNVVKLVLDRKKRALYFSRSPIPFFRETPTASSSLTEGSLFLKHLGYYAYRQSFLETFTRLPPTPLETAEMLEQLRALEHGYPIQVAISPWETFGVDTPDDLAKVARILDGNSIF
ncbi:MAG: 3-deoxy-manno-octulosonate cytidylyltransferase [Deltaproteobacteria bacterium]|nr:3-deoxy-manno-octulosonate cytidylyltransferase [Deltaproteobacteria bacterium]